MDFTISIIENNITKTFNFQLEETRKKLAPVIQQEGEFWKGEFWRNYNFLFCLNQDKIYFIRGRKFKWKKIIEKYPNLWDNKILIGYYQSHQRNKKLKKLFKK